MKKRTQRDKLKGNIWKFHIFNILSSVAFFVPIIVLFWQDNGLNMTEIMLLQSFYAITVVLLEIPTGYFADIFGRKKSLFYSSFFLILASITYTLGFHFYHFLIAELCWALGNSLISGSDSAFLYDTLIDLKQENKFKKIFGHAIFLGLFSLATANIIGGFIGKINFRLTFALMIPFLLILIPLTISMNEPKRHKLIFQKNYLFELLNIIKHIIFENKKLKWVIIYSATIYSLFQAAVWFYQPYFSLSNIDIIYFGIIFASFQIVAAISSKYAHAIEEKLGEKFSLIMLFILVGGSYLLMSNFVFMFSFIFAFIQQFVRGFYKVVLSDYIHRLTKSDIRATVMSAQNMLSSLFYAILVPFAGFIADAYSLLQALTTLGITTLVIGFVLIFTLHKAKVI